MNKRTLILDLIFATGVTIMSLIIGFWGIKYESDSTAFDPLARISGVWAGITTVYLASKTPFSKKRFLIISGVQLLIGLPCLSLFTTHFPVSPFLIGTAIGMTQGAMLLWAISSRPDGLDIK